VALEIFDRLMPQPNQISKQLPDYHPTAEDLLRVPEGEITETGLKQNVAIGLGYLEAWLRGIGCVPLFNLMEDAATAEISRAQLWQWVHHKAKLSDGRVVDLALVEGMIASELERQKIAVDAVRYAAYEAAADLMLELVRAPKFIDFLTLSAYQRVLKEEGFCPNDKEKIVAGPTFPV
jgi:malate synthase